MRYRLFLYTNLALSVLTLIAYLAPYVSPDTSEILYFIGTGYSWLLVGHILFLLFWVWRKRRYWILSVLTLLASWSNIRSVINFSGSAASDKDALRILTYNMHILSADYAEMSRKDIGKVTMFFQLADADIVCLQEIAILNKVAKDRISKLGLLEAYPYWHKSEKVSNVILSKYPIQASGVLPLGDYGNGCIYADITYRGQPLRVYNMHLHSNKVTDKTNRIIEDATRANRPDGKDVRNIANRVSQGSVVRAQQAKKIAAHMAQYGKAAILCGDMNETPVSYTYRRLSRNLTDSFIACGFGFGSTYAGKIPLLRIDYILSSKHLKTLDYHRYKPDFSDHYPIMAELSR